MRKWTVVQKDSLFSALSVLLFHQCQSLLVIPIPSKSRSRQFLILVSLLCLMGQAFLTSLGDIMLNLLRAALCGTAMCSAVAFAAGVDSANVTVFEDGAPAQAASMNANFQALVDAINASAATIAAHEERIAALESNGTSGGSTPVSNSVAGNSYSIVVSGVIHRSGNNGYHSVNNYSSTFTANFNDNGTMSITGLENEAELGLFLKDTPLEGGFTRWELDSELKIQLRDESRQADGAFSQTGSTVTIPDLGLTLEVAFDGSVVVGTGFRTGTESVAGGFVYSESNMVVGVRVE